MKKSEDLNKQNSSYPTQAQSDKKATMQNYRYV